MIPQGGSIGSSQLAAGSAQTSRTYRLDLVNKRIVGTADGLEAVRQAVLKILQTERFAHEIYTANYAAELADLPGQGATVVRTEIGRRIRTALLRDDRISDVVDMDVTVAGDTATASFTVVTVYGAFGQTAEV